MRLYYEDCHCTQFEATVLCCTAVEAGYCVTLDATAFYPEGGGQACDLGVLGDARVLDVREQGDAVVHLCDAPLPVGARVRGCIDYERRLDLMQQHSGEHIVSGILCAKFGCHNVGFHVGKDRMEIDFDTPIPASALPEIELLANEAVWKNLPIRCYYPSEEALASLPYRSKKALAWPVRIVEIPGYDLCACCGVHVAHTGEIGLIKLLSCVKLRQGVRIEMVCGKRALRCAQSIFAQNQAVSQAFSAKPDETGAAAMRMNEALAAAKLRADTLQTRLFGFIAASYAGQGNVAHFESGLGGSALRELCEAIARVSGGRAVVLTEAEDGCNICMLGDDLSALTAALREKFPLRGGGKSGSFQGSIRARKEDILAFLRVWG